MPKRIKKSEQDKIRDKLIKAKERVKELERQWGIMSPGEEIKL